jgi:hypothetical protein
MAFNGSGVFARIYNWATESASPPIAISKLDTQEEDIAAGLSNCITKDGQTTITAAIPFNDKRITGLGNATADADALNRVTADTRYGFVAAGSFTGTLTGFGSNPTDTVFYRIIGNVVTLYLAQTFSGTSNATTMTMTGLPAAVQPSIVRGVVCNDIINNGNNDMFGAATISADTITFYLANTSAVTNRVVRTASAFTASGTKGLSGACVISYPLS